MIYQPKNFKPYEFISNKLYDKLKLAGKLHYVWYLIDPRMMLSMDTIRDRHGSIIVNTWHWGGKRNESGFRSEFCTTGAEFSQHRFGRAADSVPIYSTPEEIRQDIIDHPEIYPHITSMEMDIDWVHIDVRNHTSKDKLLTFYP